MSKSNVLLFLVLFLFSSCKSQLDLQKTPIGLINNISYKNSKYSNSNAGNGFLVNFDNKTYAITAKHVLMIAKTPKMKFLDFAGELDSWKMHPKSDSSHFLILDKLLNSNKTEPLNWESMNDDWLVFSIKENNTNHQSLKLRKKPLVKDEKLFIIGWAYSDIDKQQKVYEFKYAKTDGNFHEIIQVNGPESLAGLSGSPIVDINGDVVGLVSTGWKDEKSGEVFVAASRVNKIISFLSNL